MYPIPANATRIRYLESTGTQYVDTGYILNTASKIEVSGKWTYYATGVNDAQQMGIIKDTDSGQYRTVFGNQSTACALFAANASPFVSNSGLPDVTYFVDFTNLVAKVNSTQASVSSSSLTGTFTRPFYLFARCESGTTPGLFCQFRLKSAKFWTNGVLVRSFVPVRVGQVGYLFDRVSGQLFGNAGTGDFVLGPDTFATGVLPTRMMVGGVRKKRWPWDYRVEYFEVETTQPYFECGPIYKYNENWPEPDGDTYSDIQIGIRNNSKGWFVFSYPKALSTHQRLMGNYSTFYVRGRVSKYEMGGFNSWFSNPSSLAANANSINTKTVAFYESLGSDTVKLGIIQGQTKNTTTESVSGLRSNYAKPFPILKTAEYGSYVNGDIYAGTRFYESGFDFNISGNLELHLRFVPCVKNNAQYICEVNSGTMIPLSGTGSLISGPQVADNYKAWDGQT